MIEILVFCTCQIFYSGLHGGSSKSKIIPGWKTHSTKLLHVDQEILCLEIRIASAQSVLIAKQDFLSAAKTAVGIDFELLCRIS